MVTKDALKNVASEATTNSPVRNATGSENEAIHSEKSTPSKSKKTSTSPLKKTISRRKMVFGTIPSRAAEHEAGNSFMEEYEKYSDSVELVNAIEGNNNNFTNTRHDFSTEESSDALSSINSTISSEFGNYEVIEYDLGDPNGPYQDGGISYLNLSPPSVRVKASDNLVTNSDNATTLFPRINFLIEDDSPAAAAVRANAQIHVSTVGKAARAVHLQSIRRFAKFAAGANKTGYRKGKPPRLPPASAQNNRRRYADGPFGGPGRHQNSGSIAEEDEIEAFSEYDEGEGQEEYYTADSQDDDEDKINHLKNDINDDQAFEFRKADIPNNSFERAISLPHLGNKHHTESLCIDDALLPKKDPCTSISLSTPLPQTKEGDISDSNEIVSHLIEQQSQLTVNDKLNTNSTSCEQNRLIDSEPKQMQDMVVMKNSGVSTAHFNDGVAQGTIEAGKKVLGNVDPHDLLKLQRWRKKKRGGASSTTKSYVKGKVIDGEHELYTLSLAVMIGVRQSISRTSIAQEANNGKRWVKIQDFRTTEKYEFRPKGDGSTPPHLLAHTFKFKDYSPVVFNYLRRMYGVNEFDFLLSVCGNANFIEFISNAKSGQFFFYSSDGKYMIKTMTNAESKFLRRILPQYFKHCCENPNTMITRFFGMYRVKLYHLRRNVKFVIMNSVYFTDKPLHSFYDLKGSSLGRDAKPGQVVLKDNDLRRSLPDGALALQVDQFDAVKKQVQADCDFLESMEIMDYSMLVGVHHVPSIDHQSNSRLPKETNSRISKSQTEVSVCDSPIKPGSKSPIGSSRFSEINKTPRTATRSHRRKLSLKNLSFDDGLDDDDSSYLAGSVNHPSYSVAGSSGIVSNEETERKKRVTIEKVYWPFHLWFDIHGHRRVVPAEKPYDTFSDEDRKILKGYNIPEFVRPPSDRKDGGYEMDCTGFTLPLTIKDSSGKERQCSGKLFYMGVIDVLQEYTARKSLETTYRSLLNNGKSVDVSCVPPSTYGARFVSFFAEYAKPAPNPDECEC